MLEKVVKKFQVMGNQMSYQELVQKVTMYIDNELSKEEEMKLLKEIKLNPAYSELLGKEQSFREFLRSKIQRRKVSPTLIQSIKDKIRIPSSVNPPQ